MHIVSSTFNQLAPFYHTTTKIYLDTIITQKKSCIAEDTALMGEKGAETNSMNSCKQLVAPFVCKITIAELKEYVYKCGLLASPSSCPLLPCSRSCSWENICEPLQIVSFSLSKKRIWYFSISVTLGPGFRRDFILAALRESP